MPSFGLVVEDEANYSATSSGKTDMVVWRIDALEAAGEFGAPEGSRALRDAWGHAALTVGTQVLGYNRQLERWEPLVEPWQIVTELNKTVALRSGAR